jgi:hypothetical protein
MTIESGNKPIVSEVIGIIQVIQHIDSEDQRTITLDPTKKENQYDHARIVENMKNQPGEFD